jgi:hypothetical protein
MATGDIKWFTRALLDLGEKIHDLSSDTYKLGIVTTSTVPSRTTADPRWGTGGTTNFSSTQVATGTAYTGPITLGSITWTEVSNVPTFRAANVTINQDGSGFTNGAYGIIYNDTAAGKQCIGFIELSSGGTLSLVAGSVTIDWSGANGDILTLTQS